ncbi:hypothetical protein Tco_0682160 [Tanacetum coccineum]|uniref:Uncharacterized protein n=1 Tax=Tanacetum coccineum TaxID=301880 RepID=A0ABQ4XRA0_9ASTR
MSMLKKTTMIKQKFTNPFCTPVQEIAESSLRNIGTSNMHPSTYLRFRYDGPKELPLTLVRGKSILASANYKTTNLQTDPEMSMQEELHQFDRLQVWELVDKPFGKNVIKLKCIGGYGKQKGETKLCSLGRLSGFLSHMLYTSLFQFIRIGCGRTASSEWSMRRSSQAVNKSPTHYPCDSARTFRVILFSIHNDEWKSFQCHHQTALRRPYALSWKPCQGDSLNLPDHRIHKDGDGDASFQLKSDSLPHAHAQTTKTFYKHQDSRIMKAQELKTKTSAQTLIYKIFLQRYQVYQGRLLASFQDDAKYEHVGQDTRSQGGKDDQDGRIKI